MKWTRRTTFYQKLLFSYIAIAMLFLIPVIITFYQITFKTLLLLYQENLSAVLTQKNDIMDREFERTEAAANYIILERSVFDAFESINASDSSLLQADRSITESLYKYTNGSEHNNILLATDRFVFGRQDSSIPVSGFADSAVYDRLKEMKNDGFWVSSYTIPEMFHTEGDYRTLDSEYYFSFVQNLNLKAASLYYKGYLSDVFSRYISVPAVLASYSTDFYADNLEGIIPVKDTFYFVLDEEKRIVYHSNSDIITEPVPYSLPSSSHTPETFTHDGINYLLCHAKSKITGWTTYAAIPYSHIGVMLLSDLKQKIFLIFTLLTVCCAILVAIITRFLSRPIRLLSHAMKSTGEGHFETHVDYEVKDEFGEIFTHFNEMNEHIAELIDTNYKSALRRQEAELSALHFQLNPHFLYNTLNIINLMVLKGENQLSSDIIIRLSRMLNYTTRTDRQKMPLSEDLEWLSNYFYITNIRFGCRISMEMQIQPELYNCLVPKLFLQPFIENSIIHGFSGKPDGCTIKITGFLFEEKCIFEVSDNGCGIEPGLLEKLNGDNRQSVGIANVRHRIELLYSVSDAVRLCSEPGQGTRVLITLPVQRDEGLQE